MLDEHWQVQAGARALGRMRTSQERQPAAALHLALGSPRHLVRLARHATSSTSTSSSSTSTSSTCCAVRTTRLFRGRARGFPQRRARRGAQGAIPVSGWLGGLLGSGPWPAPAGCAPPAGPAGLRRAVALHRSRPAVAIRGPCGPWNNPGLAHPG
jgi:hypothetical protein